MTILNILSYPDPVLRQESQPVTQLTQDVKTLIQDMKDTMIACGHAIGLSAIQVGVPLRIIIVDKGEEGLVEYINPVIVSATGRYSVQEGCLSLPGIEDGIQRAKDVTFMHHVFEDSKVSPWTISAASAPEYFVKLKEETVTALMAVVIQHEVDHLNGVLMYDHMSKAYQKRVDKMFKVKSQLVCPRCESTNLGPTSIPGGADRMCKNCGTQFDVFIDDNGKPYGGCYI